MRSVFALTFVLATIPSTLAEVAPPPEIWPGADYDPAIPSPESMIGHRLGERLTVPADIGRYFEALQKSAPDRMVMGEYGRTWEGRPLIWAAISSAANIARLDAIRAASLALSDPRRTDRAAADALMAEQPVIVWLAYSVHGDEVSAAEASMAVARHLLASRGDGRVADMLEKAVVVMIPMQNPDGRDRFLGFHEAARGLEVDDDPLAAEKTARNLWPRGRYNHYLFDLNRDWLTMTQPETRGHSRLLLGWRPQVVVDAHEMGTNESFFFPPEAEPINPLLPEAQVRNRAIFGRAHAKLFDREGIDYFTREVYDAFYPGYGDSWPAYLGAVGMTYEQASARGLAGRRRTGEVLTLFDSIRHHALASLSTIDTAAANRALLLSDFYAYLDAAVDEGRRRGAWILPASVEDPGAAERLAELLTRLGIEVARAEAGFKACGRSYEAGTYLVDLAQPQSRLAQVVLDPSIEMGEAFVAEQERRRAKRLPAEMYDVTAWSLPESFNTPAIQCSRISVTSTPIELEVQRAPRVTGADEAVAYVVPAGSQALRFLTMALREGLKVRSADAAFTLGGRPYRSGSLILTRAANPSDLAGRVAAISAATGAAVEGVRDTWVTEGPSFGSGRTPAFVAPRVALAWDEPTRPTSAGGVRYLIEREYAYPVTVIRTADLEAADLSRYDVLILPDGDDFADRLGEEGIASLRSWVHRGGVLVGIGGAVEMMADPASDMLAARRERLAAPDKKTDEDEGKDETEDDRDDGEQGDEDEADPDDGTVAGTILRDEKSYLDALRPEKTAPDEVSGALARAVVDSDHWLSAGAAPNVNVMVTGTAIYEPIRLDKGVNVVRFAAPDELAVGGHIWEENRQQLAFKPVVMVQPHENGYFIAFTQDPAARGLMRGLDVLFLNAIFRGAAHATRVRP